MTSLTRELLESADADAFLETGLKNIRYLSGFCGTSAVILAVKGAREPVLITDARYYGSIRDNTRGLFRAVESSDFTGSILQLCERAKVKTLAYNGDYLTVGGLNRLKKRLGRIRTESREDIIASFRSVKNGEEIKRIKAACGIADGIFLKLEKKIKPGAKEGEIKNLIYNMSRDGSSEGCSFEPIVASGPNSAVPHYYGGSRRILANDIVLVDMGFIFKGYSSDLTRVLFTGKIKPIFKKIYNIILKASDIAVEKSKPGAGCSSIDREVRKFISSSGYGKYFLHSTGHGIGLEVHEKPYLSPRSGETLANGNVFTVEPGIYLPGTGGVRIEDVFSLNKGIPVRLSKSRTYNF